MQSKNILKEIQGKKEGDKLNMAAEYREQIKKMLENIDDEDIVFLRQIYTMFKVHLQIQKKK